MAAAEGVGLAANQIGVDLRVFVYDCPDDDGDRGRGVVVNPVLETSAGRSHARPDDDDEGCLSVPGEQFPTGRAEWARVTRRRLTGGRSSSRAAGSWPAACSTRPTTSTATSTSTASSAATGGPRARAVKRNGWGVPGLSWDPASTGSPRPDVDRSA